MRLLLGFGYDGSKFTGFQKGIGNHSVESEILSCIREHDLGTHFISCSRTDRGVSALMNTASIDTDLSPSRIMGTLNSHLDDIYFHRYAVVEDNFRVRYVSMKTYVYILPDTYPYNKIKLDDLKKFEGTHDFEKYCKLDRKETTREIKEIFAETYLDSRILLFRARGFLWNQIRFMMGYAIERIIHPSTPPDPFHPAYNARRLAPPNFLVLRDIEYPNVVFTGFPSKKKENISKKLFENSTVQSFLGKNLSESLKRK